jgi:hypothetical protein
MTQNRGGNKPGADAPARGGAQVIPQTPGQSSPATNAARGPQGPQPLAGSLGAETDAKVVELGDQPGTGASRGPDPERSRGVRLEGLGSLDDVEDEDDSLSVDEEGEGDKVVILFDYVSGAPVRNKGGDVVRAAQPFTKGKVVRISRLLPSYGRNQAAARAEAKRLLDQGAIRLATSEERDVDYVELAPDGNTPEAMRERNARIEAERKVEELTEELRLARMGQGENLGREPTPPGAGA